MDRLEGKNRGEKKVKTGKSRVFHSCVEQCMMGAEQFMASATRRHSVFNGRTREDTGRRVRTTCVDVDSNNRKHPSNELKQRHHLPATVGTTPTEFNINGGQIWQRHGQNRKTEYVIKSMCRESQQP